MLGIPIVDIEHFVRVFRTIFTRDYVSKYTIFKELDQIIFYIKSNLSD